MAVVNGTSGRDFIHRLGDGRIVPAGWIDVGGVTTANDTLYGLAADDYLFGDLGNDSLVGGAGNDIMDGGGGDDLYFVDSALDKIIEAVNGGVERVFASLNYALTADAEVEILSTAYTDGTAALTLTGNAFGQSLIGNAGNSTLNGGGGDDVLTGFAGNDVLNGGTGVDTLRGGIGDDVYFVDGYSDPSWPYDFVGDAVAEVAGQGFDRVMASSDYVLTSGASVELLNTTNTAGTDAVDLTGNEFDQTIYGNAGNNRLIGGGGNDVLKGLGGDDEYWVDGYFDSSGTYTDSVTIIETADGGDDLVRAMGAFVLDPGCAIETIQDTSHSTIVGNELSQTLISMDYGSKGTLDSPVHANLYGAGGNDTYIVTLGDSVFESDGAGIDSVL